MYCTKCGTYIAQGQHYCMQCGKKVEKKPARGKKRMVITVVCVFVLISGILIIKFCADRQMRADDSAVSNSFRAADAQRDLAADRQMRDADSAVSNSFRAADTQRDLANDYTPTAIEVMIADCVTYEVLDNADEYMTIRITAPNMYDLFKNLTVQDVTIGNDADEIERIETKVKNALIDNEYTTVTNTVTVQTLINAGVLEIVPNEAYIDALYGGMITYYNEIIHGRENIS